MKTKVRISSGISDEAEREQALSPDESFIVQAPAGSGKTGLLVQRILRLLSVVKRPESIVAMTFTIKAAAEMRERVIRAMEEASEQTPVTDSYGQRLRDLAIEALAQDHSQGWQILRNPRRLQIQTIDAFCAMLVRRMPIVSEAGGVGTVVEDPEELYRLAARRMLQSLADMGDDERLLLGRVALYFENDIARLERQIASMLGKRDQWQFSPFEDHEPVVNDFRRLLESAEAELRQIFREQNVVDFSEVTRSAITALGEPEAPTDLLYSLDYRIEHLLVDEFQDTSKAQYQLLDALTGQWSDHDGRTLFLVGDPMQSIYRFRAAEVALFAQAWQDERLGSVRLQPLRLKTNFRSTPEIVNWTYDHLSHAVGETDIAKGAVKLEPPLAARKSGNYIPQVIPFLDDKGGESEAQEVVRLIRSAPSQDSIAILVRSRSHVVSILPALRQAGIRYRAVAIEELKEQQHILDLLALTRAICHLADRVSWLACLRAPWCGLTLADLSALAETEPERTVFDLLSDPAVIGRLSSDGRFRAVRVQEIMSAALNHLGRLPLRDLIEQAWFALGGPAILSQTNQREDAQTFFGLIESFEEGGTIADFSLLSNRLELLYAKPDSEDARVQVMTIHEAKGLEFDIVILPQLAKAPRGDDDELIVWNESVEPGGTVRLEIAAQPQKSDKTSAYARVKEQLKDKNRNEGKRLFYVACTRAKNRLYLLGSVNRNKQRTDVCNAASHTFLGMIWEHYKPDFRAVLQRSSPAQGNLFESEARISEGCLYRIPHNWHPPSLDASVQWLPSLRLDTASMRRVTYEWVSNTGRHVGTVVHGMLNRIVQDPAKWTLQAVRGLEPAVQSELSRLGVGASQLAPASARVIRALSTVMTSQRGKWILDAHRDAHSEWPIQGILQDRLIAGTVDRMFRDLDGRLWIIDFKTSEHRGGSVEIFLQEEERRYRTQMENYAAIASRLVEGPIWLGLYFPLLDAWREWQFSTEAELTAH